MNEETKSAVRGQPSKPSNPAVMVRVVIEHQAEHRMAETPTLPKNREGSGTHFQTFGKAWTTRQQKPSRPSARPLAKRPTLSRLKNRHSRRAGSPNLIDSTSP